MPFTSVSQIRQAGGIDDSLAFNLFWLADDAALNALITPYVTVAAAWVASRAGASAYAAAALDANLTALFAQGESYVALHFLFPALQSRRVLGTHYPLQQEGSERFEELVGTQWMELANDLLEPYLTAEEEGKPFAMPAFVLGSYVTQEPDDPGGAAAQDLIIEDLVDNARSLTIGPPVTP